MKSFRLFVCLSLVFLFCSACASRIPSAKTAQSASTSYFKHYAHKYPDSVFGHKNFANTTINSVEEISYRYALIDSIVQFADGKQGRALLRMQNNFPRGWRVVSWEMLGYR